MSSDQRVQRGQRLSSALKAPTINTLLDAARAYRLGKLGPQGGEGIDAPLDGGLTVLIKNATDDFAEVGDVLALTGAPVNPADLPLEFVGRPVFTAAVPAASTDVVVVLRDGLDIGGVGVAVLIGDAVVTLSVSDLTHKFALPIANDSAKMASAGSGYPVLWKATDETTPATGEQEAVVLLTGGGGGGGATQSLAVMTSACLTRTDAATDYPYGPLSGPTDTIGDMTAAQLLALINTLVYAIKIETRTVPLSLGTIGARTCSTPTTTCCDVVSPCLGYVFAGSGGILTTVEATNCCPGDPVPVTIYATITAPGCAFIDGRCIEMHWNTAQCAWEGVILCTSSAIVGMAFSLSCNASGDWVLIVTSSGGTSTIIWGGPATSSSCGPLVLDFDPLPVIFGDPTNATVCCLGEGVFPIAGFSSLSVAISETPCSPPGSTSANCCGGPCGAAGVPATLTGTITDKVGCFTEMADSIIGFSCITVGGITHSYQAFALGGGDDYCSGQHAAAWQINCGSFNLGTSTVLEWKTLAGLVVSTPAEAGITCSPFSAVFLLDDGAGNTATVTCVE